MNDKRIKEISGERFNPFGEGKTCEGCMFAYGDTPMDDAPDKCSCAIYQAPERVKPSEVLEGGHCKYRREKTDIQII